MNCPDCRAALAVREKLGKQFHFCGSCEGQALTLSVLKAEIDREFARDLWAHARPVATEQLRRCPGCRAAMQAVNPPEGDDSADLVIEICRSCQLIWLDAGELQKLPRAGKVSAGRELSPDARAAIAFAKLEQIAAESRLTRAVSSEPKRRYGTRDGWDSLADLLRLLGNLID